MARSGSKTPWSYILIRLLFRFVLKIFYGSIVIENAHLVPETGIPCIVCANHSNSLTDALSICFFHRLRTTLTFLLRLLVTSIPSKRRNMLRLTAKATQFGHKTFTSWLIESAGTVAIKRRKDYAREEDADNTNAMSKLMEALELGDAICLFPEGASRYHPTIAPLKTGVARIVSDALTRNRDDFDFEISVLTCSITYMHRQNFRSDVLVTFHEPMVFTPKSNPELLAPVDYQNIRALTSQLHQKISAGTWDAPSWDLIRTAKLAARIYAPLGTCMTLGDHVRLSVTFQDTFKAADVHGEDTSCTTAADQSDFLITEISQLREDLKAYQDQIAEWGIKDDRIRRPLPRHAIISRLFIRLAWATSLFIISLPGLLLWLPVFVTTFYAVHNFKKTGPIFDTWDEIAQYKLTYGLISGICAWIFGVVMTWPIAHYNTPFLVPLLMWMTIRWLEDTVSAFRAFTTLLRLLHVGKSQLKAMHEKRSDLHSQVMNLAINTLGLPSDPERYFRTVGGRQKGRIQGRWEGGTRYFSIKRRRKRDWNETLRLYDKVDYPEDDSI